MMRATGKRPADSDPGALAWAVWAVWPSLTLAMAVLVAASPGARGAMPVVALVPVAVIFSWCIRRRAALASPVVFGCGIVLDAVSHGPAGYWALVYVVVLILARTVGEFACGSVAAQAAMLAACFVVACGLQAGLLAVHGAELPALGEMAVSVGVALIVYPLLAAVLSIGGGPAGMAAGLRFTPQGRS